MKILPKSIKNNIFLLFFLVLLLILGFFFRIHGLADNYSFWIDEFSSGQFAASILKIGSPETVSGLYEPRNLLSHYLIATSMRIWGINEFAGRFPSVIFGTLTILAVFFVFSNIFNKRIGLSGAILTAFSIIEITWSRQARSYALFQLSYLISAYFLWLFFKKLKEGRSLSRELILFFITFLISFLSHLLAITLVGGGLFFCLLFERDRAWNYLKGSYCRHRVSFLVFLIVVAFLLWKAGLSYIVQDIFISQRNLLKIYNNLWYYHSFLWRQYPLIVFLAFLGVLKVLLHKEKTHLFLISVIFIHTLFVVFFVRWFDTRYIFAVFPLFFFGYMLYFLDFVSEILVKNNNYLRKSLILILSIFIVLNGYKFSFRPKMFYSPNADMREIPLVDYNLAYDRIKTAIRETDGEIVVIDTWGERIAWYLGRDYIKSYLIRNITEGNYDVIQGEKIDKMFHFGIVKEKSDLINVLSKNKKGFVFIDGHEIPYISIEALSYIQKNLKLEMKFDRFSLDPDPYDTWPAWLYSWGMNQNIEY